MQSRRGSALLLAFLMLPVLSACTLMAGNTDVTTPEEHFGHEIGADYVLPNYQQLSAYWETLADESPRMTLQTIGDSQEGRPQLMAIITSPANHRNLDRYRDIAERLARADGLSEDEARALADEGKAVVWIDGGLHATEVLGAQQLMELVYQMVSRDDAETLRFLDDVIILAAHANPDGHDLVADWYMRNDDPMNRSSQGVPVLYQKYAGHDNNRDVYMSNLAETTNMNRILYREWFPQIVYNHHQTGPAGTIMFAPPFRDPPNHYLDPLIITSLDGVGAAMHGRFVQEGKGGTTMRSGASYSTWWNGGVRTTPYFKNQIGLLTETNGHPNPMEIPFLPARQITSGDLPLPVEPGTWHFRQAVDYSITANRAVLDYASRNRENLLFNIWRMGMNSIERGSGDSWSILPDRIAAATADVGQRGSREDYERLLKNPEHRDPRAYILPRDEGDYLTATKFVNALLKNGVIVHRATGDFSAEGKSYPAGSYVVQAAQAFRPHVLDMFEPQNHPNDFAYPGAPPTAPYDNAGWTLAYQMGVSVDRIMTGVDGPFEEIADLASAPAGVVSGPASPAGFVLERTNDAYLAVNRLLREGHSVYWLKESISAEDHSYAPGAFYIPAGSGPTAIVRDIAANVGLDFQGVADQPASPAIRMRPVRIGLWDQYGGSMPSGWTRFILENFDFDFEVVYPPELDRGNLADRFDVLIFENGAIPRQDGGGGFGGGGQDADFAASVPEEYRGRIGRTTVAQTVPQILDFIRGGGTAIAIGSSTSLAYHAGLPVRDHLVDGQGNPLASEDYYVPGSVLDLRIDNTSPLAHGLDERANVLFSRNPLFRLDANASARGVTRVGWFDTAAPLRSGWAWGQEKMNGGSAILDANVGSGRLFLFTPLITFRGQSHGTFSLLFNGIYLGTGEDAQIAP
jgi:hypothetical protein